MVVSGRYRVTGNSGLHHGYELGEVVTDLGERLKVPAVLVANDRGIKQFVMPDDLEALPAEENPS